MALDKALDTILNTGSKVKIIRLFISRRRDFMASGRRIAKLVNLTAPTAHAALKELYNQDILRRDIVGRQHIYKINQDNRVVKNILEPAFKKEHSVREDISDFLKEKIREKRVTSKIISVLLYGSFQKGATDEGSDVDVAIIAKNKPAKKEIEEIFMEDIAGNFYDYFGVHIDIYLKTKDEFTNRLKRNLPPVSKLLHSYSVVYGKDPLKLK